MPEVSLRNEKDEWQLIHDEGGPVLPITSPSGIGTATVRSLVSGPCTRFAVGLRYAEGKSFQRLEGFSVMNGDGEGWKDLPWSARCGYLRVTLPQAVFDPKSSVLTIDWGDMYRTD